MAYTMSEKARKARVENGAKGGRAGKGKPKKISEEQKERLRARAEAMKLPPRLRVMVDKALYKKTIEKYETLDKGLSALLQK